MYINDTLIKMSLILYFCFLFLTLFFFFHFIGIILRISKSVWLLNRKTLWVRTNYLFSELRFVSDSGGYSCNLTATVLPGPRRKVKVNSRGLQEISPHNLNNITRAKVSYHLPHWEASNSRTSQSAHTCLPQFGNSSSVLLRHCINICIGS